MVEAVGPTGRPTRRSATAVFGITGGGAQAEYVAVPAVALRARARRPRPRRDGRRARGVRHRARRDGHPGARRSRRMGARARGRLRRRHRRAAARDGARRTRRRHRAHRRQARTLPRARARRRDRAAARPPTARSTSTRSRGRSSRQPTAARTSRSISSAATTSSPTSNAAAPKGRIVLHRHDRGRPARRCRSSSILGKRLTLIGTVLRGRDVAEKAAATDAFVRDVVPLLADGRIAPIVDATLPLDRGRRRVRRCSRPTRRSARSSSTAARRPGQRRSADDRDDELVARRSGRLHAERPLGVEADHPGEHAFEVAGLDDRLHVVRVRRPERSSGPVYVGLPGLEVVAVAGLAPCTTTNALPATATGAARAVADERRRAVRRRV